MSENQPVETCIFISQDKNAVSDFVRKLAEAGITSSIKIHTYVRIDKSGRSGPHVEEFDERNDLAVPLSLFGEELTDAQEFEVYILFSAVEKAAEAGIISLEPENCVFFSDDGERAHIAARFLEESGMQGVSIIQSPEGTGVFVEPEDVDFAAGLIEERFERDLFVSGAQKAEAESFRTALEKSNSRSWKLFLALIIVFFVIVFFSRFFLDY